MVLTHADSTWIILPVYNRRAVTLRCLEHLRATGVMDWARTVVVDDGSTDGTAAAVEAAFRPAVVLVGDGSLYWAGAICLGMRHAVSEGAKCVVWLNDDSHPVRGAVERVTSCALQTGAVCAGLGRFVGVEKEHTFTALYRDAWGLRERPVDSVSHSEPFAVDACRGNLVAIPRAVIDKIGYPDAENLPQYFADTDYSLRATAAGFTCLLVPLATVEEMEHSGDFDYPWLTTPKPLREIWARFGTVQAGLYWRANWVYLVRHWGWGRGALLFARPYLRLAIISLVRLAVPQTWIRRFLPGKVVDTR